MYIVRKHSHLAKAFGPQDRNLPGFVLYTQNSFLLRGICSLQNLFQQFISHSSLFSLKATTNFAPNELYCTETHLCPSILKCHHHQDVSRANPLKRNFHLSDTHFFSRASCGKAIFQASFLPSALPAPLEKTKCAATDGGGGKRSREKARKREKRRRGKEEKYKEVGFFGACLQSRRQPLT